MMDETIPTSDMEPTKLPAASVSVSVSVTNPTIAMPQGESSSHASHATRVQSESRILGSGPVSGLMRVSDLQDKVLGDFRLLRRIGGGGMAEVWLAEQISLRRQVAIKVMHPSIQSDEICRKRFEQEAFAAAGLNHPNIVQVYGIGDSDGIRYIAQEYVAGLNMRDYIAKKGPPPLNIAMHLMKQVAAALQAAGEAGIVHRDVKPENILLTKKGMAKVVDFGLAQLTQGGDMRLTQQGTTMGTPLYMSPEQVQGNKVDHRSDMYSLGITFFHLLSGRPPFRGETAFAIAYHQVHTEPPKLNELRADLPSSLCDAVQRLMAKQPDARFATAHDLLVELRSIEKRLSNGETAESSSDSSMPIPSIESPPLTRTRLRQWGEWLDPRQHPRASFALLAFLILAMSSSLGARSVNSGSVGSRPVLVRTAKQANVRDQLTLAQQFQTEDAFRAVIVWFREPSPEQIVARRELIRRLLPELRFREVESLCREITSARNAPQSDVATAWAALAIVFAMDGNMREADRIFNEQVRPMERTIAPEFLDWFREAREQRLLRPNSSPSGTFAPNPSSPSNGPLDHGSPRRGNPERRG